MRADLIGPRLLLRRLRAVMAEPVNAQSRLDRIVVLIASNMVAEVCSVYIQRADGELELYGTEGLNPEAVHNMTMKPGEGLVGLIVSTAEPVALADAQSHPAFSFKSESGEESYHSFLGVPILRGGNVLGVLVVQNRARRIYTEEEVEALQTTAMLLAEMVATGELQSLGKPGTDTSLKRQMALQGTPITEGVGLGYAVLHQPRVTIKQLIAEDVNAELIRLEAAVTAMRERLDTLIDTATGTGEQRDVLETFRMFAHDAGWKRRLQEAVRSGLTAEAAVERVQNDARAKLQRQTDPYMRERLHDLDDLADRLLHQLTGVSFTQRNEDLPDNAILIARTMGPAALLEYNRNQLRGLILEDGGASSHVAIVARALGIPCVGDVANINDLVSEGDAVILDGGTGEVQLRPSPDIESAYKEKVRLRASRQEQYRKLRDLPAKTLDGVEIGLHMNAGLLVDLPQVAESGALSIGLFRTELQFMLAPQFPRLDEQFNFYKNIMDAVKDRPVTFRTLDIGSDKVLPYMKKVEEENPALGWRAIRIGLDRPGFLRPQLRAMLRAGAGRRMRIMFPMVATVGEFIAAREIVEMEKSHLKRHGHVMPEQVELGVMVEVPSLLWQLEELCAEVDFISVGSNDLSQYIFAADRDNKRVSTRFDPLSAPFLRALQSIVTAADRAGTPVSLCGEMGGKVLEAMALVALGYRGLSMSPAAIGPVKAMILALDASDAAQFIENELRTGGDQPSLRQPLRRYAEARAIPI
ncbi:MAG: phosphoenolpyruvate--protein phosphotransferase [Hyphomicrobiales bacterium]|nr:phosphoenolpyruvate--protein phosphotransferase [Hyphomicrobiales bacterium]